MIVETPWGLMPEPKFATKRNWDRPTHGHLDAAFARIWLGSELMPSQLMLSDLAGEYDPETGLPSYPLVVTTGPRRAGKTFWDFVRKARKMFGGRNRRGWYTAQTGVDAQDAFLKFHDEVVSDAALGRVVRTLRSNGHAVMHFPNGSTIKPHPPTEKGLHGTEGDDNTVDEGWAFDRETGKVLMQAIAPTQMTRFGAQTFIDSAGGTAESTWLADLVARGRAGDPSILYVEFGIPDDLPLDDLEAILHYHPAFGHTLNLAGLENLRTQITDDNEFARAAGNRWTEVIGGVIPGELWKSVQWPDPVPDDGNIGYGAARADDGSQVAIVAAVQDGPDRIVVEVCDLLPTAYRAAEHVEGWAGSDVLAVDRAGASAALYDELVVRDNTEPLAITGRDVSAACAQLLDAMGHKGVVFRPHPAMDAAVQVAGKRSLGDGGWVWAHTAAGAPIAVLKAATLAVWALRHRPAPVTGKPKIRI